MTTRRTFLGLLTMSAVAAVYGAEAPAAVETFKGKDVFDKLLKKAEAGKWAELPIGECMKRVARCGLAKRHDGQCIG
jgi:hypothetical protein